MIRSSLLGLTATLALAISTSAQAPMPFPVVNSGSPGAVDILGPASQSVQIGTTLTVTATWPASQGLAVSLIALGYGTGNLQDWSGILSFCAPGPSLWYLAPFGTSYDLYAVVGDSVTMNLPIPNQRALHFLLDTFYIQGLHADFTNACWAMSKAYGIPISL